MGKRSSAFFAYEKASEKIENNQSYYFYFQDFKNKVINMFNFDIKGISSNVINEFLFNNGHCAIVNSPLYGWIVPQSYSVLYDCYNVEPKKIFYNVPNETGAVEPNDFIFIKNDYSCNSEKSKITQYCRRLKDIDITIDIELRSLRRPYILTGSKDEELSLKILTDQIDSFSPYIILKDSFNLDNVRVLNLNTNNNLDDLECHKREIRNDCLTALGISNVNVFKKERLIQAESNGNNEDVERNFNSKLDTRIQAVEEMKEKISSECELYVNVYTDKGISKVPYLEYLEIQAFALADAETEDTAKGEGETNE